MKRILTMLVLGCVAPLLMMCRSTPRYNGPVSKICRYEGAQRGETVLLRCQGIGTNHTTAVIDAKKAASWYVASRILKTPNQRQRFSEVSRAFYKRYNSFLNNVEAKKSINLNDDGNPTVSAKIQVNRNEVVKFLKDFGVIKNETPDKKVGKPSIGVVLRSKLKTRDPAWNALARNSASEFLTERGYNAVDTGTGVRKMNALERRVVKSQNLPMDAEYRASLMMGADIMLEITVWNKSMGASTKGAAAVKAYETTTKRLIGSSSAFGEELPMGNQTEFKTMKQAIQTAVERVLSQVQGYWTSDAVKGNRYYLIVAGDMNATPDMADVLAVRLKKTKGINELKRTTATSSRAIFYFQSPLDNIELSLLLKRTMRSTPGVKFIKIPIQTRKFFLITFNHGKTINSKDPDALPPGI